MSPIAGQRPLLLQIRHRSAALDDLETVRLLDHDAQQRDRRTQSITLQRGCARALGLAHRDRAERMIATLHLGVAFLRMQAGAAGEQRGNDGCANWFHKQ
jgi:hypothetical protein